ncbi:LAMI_0D04918g1_1 [Lachancea mirantina]|uniref:LAMI_0D04918g1_1 n=1 Tax=Lachancea mirantina TaxID=1230905 RepID=A0A1G4JAW8_9SACH|nr:LAMI_0D04918g1_1 [Lachancea mirantina]
MGSSSETSDFGDPEYLRAAESRPYGDGSQAELFGPVVTTEDAESTDAESTDADGDDSDEEDQVQQPRNKRRRIAAQFRNSGVAESDDDRLSTELEQALLDVPGVTRDEVVQTVDEIVEVADSAEKDSDADDAELVTGDGEPLEVVEISDEEQDSAQAPANEPVDTETRVQRTQIRRALDYRCPICFEPPDTALVTSCGHVFCAECVFQMVNSSRGHRKSGKCALCRKDVRLNDLRLTILRKKRVRKVQ